MSLADARDRFFKNLHIMKRLQTLLLIGIYTVILLFFAAEIGLRLNGAYKTFSEKITGRYT